jgi:hypothetical protein
VPAPSSVPVDNTFDLSQGHSQDRILIRMPFRSYVRSLPLALANSLPWLAVFGGAVCDLLMTPEMAYEHP